MPKDFYKTLGVDEKAGIDEIKKRYRTLAKKYHPDHNKGNHDAEEKFKDISEAYEVLKDDQKRQQYDTMRRFGGVNGRPGASGHGGAPGGGRFYTDADFSQAFGDRFDVNDLFGFGGLGDIFGSMFGENVRGRRGGPSGRAAGPQKGKDLRAEIKITLEQAAKGTTKKIRIAVPENCATCGGTGTVQGAGETICPRCQGSGQIAHVQGNFAISRPCPSCLGRGIMPGKPCQTCGGKGTTKTKKTIAVKIPAGIENGGTVRLRGLGYPGSGSAPTGDLIIRVTYMDNQKYKREGNDIQTSVTISFPQAALGAKVPVTALTKKIMLTIPPGTQPGTVMRLRGLGLAVPDDAPKGDLLVTVNVSVPTTLTDRQKELLREFDAAGVGA